MRERTKVKEWSQWTLCLTFVSYKISANQPNCRLWAVTDPGYHRVKTGSKRRMNKGTIAKNLKQVERRSREQGNRKTKKRNGWQSSINKTRSPDSGMRKRRMGRLDCPKIAP